MIYQPRWNQCDSEHEIEASDQIPHPLWVAIKCPPSRVGEGVKCPGYAQGGGGGRLSFDLTGTLEYRKKSHQAFSQVSCSCLAFSKLQRPCKGCHLPWPHRSVKHHQEYRPWAWDVECSSASQYHWNACPFEDRNFSSWFEAQWSPQNSSSCPWLLAGQHHSIQKGYHGGAYWWSNGE